MTPLAIRDRSRLTFVLATLVAVAAAVFVVTEAISTVKIGFYIDRVERAGLLLALGPLAFAGLVVMLKYPRLPVYVVGFLLPFNLIGGIWGDAPIFTLGKLAVNLVFIAAVLSTFLAPPADRAWITSTRLGQALLAWLLLVGVAIAVGGFSAPDRGQWLRESSWMVLYAGALPVGTLLRQRREVSRMLVAGAAGVAVMQVLAFWMLATGHRFERPDVEGGEAFFRAPFAPYCVLYLYLALAVFFYGASVKGALTRRQQTALFAAIAVLSAGLLATMGRALWISAGAGAVVILALIPWRASTVRAAAFVAAGIAASIGIVVLVDSLSPESRGNWTRLALDFLFALGEKGSPTRLGREVEWQHAFEIWKMSPVVGYGFGYPFPDNPYNLSPADAFYMHNSFMNLLAKCGALGLVSFLWMLVECIRRLFRAYRDPGGILQDRILAVALLAAVAQMLVLSLFSPAVTTSDSVLGMSVLIGLAAAHHRMMSRRAVA